MTLILRFSYPSIWKSISRYIEVYILLYGNLYPAIWKFISQ